MPHKYKCKKCGTDIIRAAKFPMFYCPCCKELAPEYIEYTPTEDLDHYIRST